jgi:ABC-2 type transport system permease protein
MSGASHRHLLLPAFTLWQRELVRFFRQRDRVLGALGTPLVFWLLLGSGLDKSFQAPSAPGGHGYLEFFFAGTVVLVLLFTAVFSSISIIEDRREGFLQAVLVAPVGRAGLVLGKLLGGTTLAMAQGAVFLLFAPLAGIRLGLPGLLWLAAAMALSGFALTGLGFVIAWRLDSTQGFHAIMNLFLIPLWLLSGAVFPAAGAPAWMDWFMRINPLSYAVSALRSGLYWEDLHSAAWPAMMVLAVFAAAMAAMALAVSRRVGKGDLQ